MMRFTILEPINECPLCGSDKRKPGHAVAIPPHENIDLDVVAYWICECGFEYQIRYMTEETFKEYYLSEYRMNKIQGTDEVHQDNLDDEEVKGKSLLRYIGLYIDEVKKALDVGCSTGTFMKLMQAEFGCKVQGVEPEIKFREYGKSNKLNIVPYIEDIKDTDFDFVSILNTLEHFLNFKELLRQMNKRMVEGGWLIVEVPIHNQYRFSHPVVFNKYTLTEALRQTGFEHRHDQEARFLRMIARKV